MMKTDSQLTRKRGRPSLNDGEAVLKNLYRVAFSHFFLSGVEGANMQLIAKEAGVSRQMIHNRFGSKELFFEAVLESGQDFLRDKFVYRGIIDIKDPWLLFNDLGHQIFSTFVDPDNVATFRMLDIAVFRHADVAVLYTKSIEEAYKTFGKLLKDIAKEQGLDIKIEKGAIRDFLSMIRGYAQPIIQGREKTPSINAQKKEIKKIVARFLRGLGFGEQPV